MKPTKTQQKAEEEAKAKAKDEKAQQKADEEAKAESQQRTTPSPTAPPTVMKTPTTAAPIPAPSRTPFPWIALIINATILLAIFLIGIFWGSKEKEVVSHAQYQVDQIDQIIASRFGLPRGVEISLTSSGMSYRESGLITEKGEVRTDTLMSVMIEMQRQQIKQQKDELVRRGVILNRRNEEVEVKGINPLPMVLEPGEFQIVEVSIGNLVVFGKGLKTLQSWSIKQEIPRNGHFNYAGEKDLDFFIEIY